MAKERFRKMKLARLRLIEESNKKYPVERITGRRTRQNVIELIPIMIEEKREFRTPEIWLSVKYQISIHRFMRLATEQQREEYENLQDLDKEYYKYKEWRKR